MGKEILGGPIHDIEEIKKLIREGKVEFAGRLPQLDKIPDFTVESVEIYGEGVTLAWQTVNAGFGQLYLFQGKDGKLHANTEGMTREFVASVLDRVAYDVIIDD